MYHMRKFRREFLVFEFLFSNSQLRDFAVEEVETGELVTDELDTDELDNGQLISGSINDTCTVRVDVVAIASLCWLSFDSATVTAVVLFSIFLEQNCLSSRSYWHCFRPQLHWNCSCPRAPGLESCLSLPNLALSSPWSFSFRSEMTKSYLRQQTNFKPSVKRILFMHNINKSEKYFWVCCKVVYLQILVTL